MPQKVKETKHTVQDNGLETLSRVMQVVFALVQILLVFRLGFKLLGANASNVFVNLIYATTAPLVGLFEGIFSEVNMEGNTFAVFEPATVIAIIVTAAVSYIVLRMLSVKQDKKIEHVEVQEQVHAVPLGQVSDSQLKQSSESPATQTSETPVAQTRTGKLETQSQELEERIRHQEQNLEHQRKTYGAAHDETQSKELETQSQELEEKIRHQKQILEDQRKTYDVAHDENQSQELEERIRHQEQRLENQQNIPVNAHGEKELDEEEMNNNNEDPNEVPVYEKRQREI